MHQDQDKFELGYMFVVSKLIVSFNLSEVFRTGALTIYFWYGIDLDSLVWYAY